MVLARDLSGNGVMPAVGDRAWQDENSSTGEFYAVVVGTPWDIACRSLYVGTGGTLNCVNSQGQTIAFANVPNGTRLDIRTKNVISVTGASGIVRLM